MCSGDTLLANADDTDTLITTLTAADLYQPDSMEVDVPTGSALRKRRENSRFAARDRRGKETELFAELREVTPVIEEPSPLGGAHLDRIALLRVACSLCRLRNGKAIEFLHSGEGESRQRGRNAVSSDAAALSVWCEQSLTECLDGFIVLVHPDGTVLYATESVSLYLGLTQSDFVGCHLAEFVHPDDYEELRAVDSGDTSNNDADGTGWRMTTRMKTVISQRGRILNYKSALYKTVVVQRRWIDNACGGVGGRLMLIHASCQPAGQPPLPSMGPASAPISLSLKDTPREQSLMGLFMTRHTCDMRFSFASEQFARLVRGGGGTNSGNGTLLGASYFDLVHPADLPRVLATVKEMFAKGQSRSGFYRLLCGRETIAWLQSEAITLAHTVKGQKGQYVLCMHHVLGIQSELDSWRPTTTESRPAQAAAQPVLTTIKQETVDVADCLVGRQPQFIDCFDFTPLIEPLPAGFTGENFHLHLDEYRPAHAPHQQRSSTSRHHQTDSTHVHSSPGHDYAATLVEWLLRDDPNEQCPGFDGATPSTNTTGEHSGGVGDTATIVQLDANISAGGRKSARKHALPTVWEEPPRHPMCADVALGLAARPVPVRPSTSSPVHPTLSPAGGGQLALSATKLAATTAHCIPRHRDEVIEVMDDYGAEEGHNISSVIDVSRPGDADEDLIEFQKCQAYAEEHGAELAPYFPLEETIPVLSDTIDIEGLFPELDSPAFQSAVTPTTTTECEVDGETDDTSNAFYRLVDATYKESTIHAPPLKRCRLERQQSGGAMSNRIAI